MRRWLSRNPGAPFLLVLAVVALAVTALAFRHQNAKAADVGAATATPNPSASVAGLTGPAAGGAAALMFGDSYFNGADGVKAQQTYGYLAARRLGYTPIMAGHGGTGFLTPNKIDGSGTYGQQVNDGSLATVSASIPLVVVEGGTNDAPTSPQQERAAAVSFLSALRVKFPAALIIVMGPPSTTGTVTPSERIVIDGLRAATASVRLRFIDESGWITSTNRSRIVDAGGVHPSVEGHKLMTPKLVTALREAGVKRAQ